MPDPTPASSATRTSKTYFSVQALRAVAALMVVSHHALSSWRDRLIPDPHTQPPWQNGQAGVDIFFVISGFVMAVTLPGLAGLEHKAWVFLRRRLIRIVPLYWVFITIKTLYLLFGHSAWDKSIHSAWPVIASYLFIPDFGSPDPIPVLAVGWTLDFEMIFYLLFTTALLLDIAPLAFLLPTLLALAALGWSAPSFLPTFTAMNLPIVLEFLFGIILAHFTLRGRLPGRNLSVLLLVGGFAALVGTLSHVYQLRAFYWGLPAAAIVTGAVALEDQLGPRLPRWLLEAGNASYAIYLVHLFVVSPIWVLLRHFHQTGAAAALEIVALALVAAFVAGEIVHRLIELPLMKLFRGKRVRGVSVLPA